MPDPAAPDNPYSRTVEVTTYAGGHEGYMRSRVVDEMLPFLSERFE